MKYIVHNENAQRDMNNTYLIDEQLIQEIANILTEYIEKIKNKHPKKASRVCKIGSKLMHLPIIKEELKDDE